MRKCIAYLTWATCASKWKLSSSPPTFPRENKGPDWLASVRAEYLYWPKVWTNQVQPCLAFLFTKSLLQIFPSWLFLLNLLSGQMSPLRRGFP